LGGSKAVAIRNFPLTLPLFSDIKKVLISITLTPCAGCHGI